MEWLNYHHLLYFWTVAREGSLRSASARLNVSQPSISAQVAALEEALGERLFARRGRGRVLTEVGQVVFGYANEIFSLGQEMMNTVKGRGPGRGRPLRVHVGVVDSIPKLVTQRILEPTLRMAQAVQVVCREGKLEDLVGQLAAHRLDVVLADESPAGEMKVRTFSHRLGGTSVTLCAMPRLARTLRPGFPGSLNDAPALLPASTAVLRRGLERWFQSVGVRPRVLGEFDDPALLKAVAARGWGFIALPTMVMQEARAHYGFAPLGEVESCREEFVAITVERRILHPAVVEITRGAMESLG